MSKNAPVRTRCPHCGKFHNAYGKIRQLNLNHVIGMAMFINLLERDPDLKPLKMQMNKILPGLGLVKKEEKKGKQIECKVSPGKDVSSVKTIAPKKTKKQII
jgi:hypothetical protein